MKRLDRLLNPLSRAWSSWSCVDLRGRSVLFGRRTYSVYPTFYIRPVYQDAEYKELEEKGELKKIAFTPILPAEHDNNASVWHDPLVVKFTNKLNAEGNKERAQFLVHKTFETIKKLQLEKYHSTPDLTEREQIVLNPWKIFHGALVNTMPFLETIPVVRGGSTYQVPVPVREKRREFLAMKWFIEAGQDKDDDLRLYKKLAQEFIDAYHNTGRVVRKKQELHKLCEANRAYAHYRWG